MIDLLVLATAFALFANPFGRFIVIGARAAGIQLLSNLSFEWVFALFLAASTISSFLSLVVFRRVTAFAEKFKTARKAIGFLERIQKTVSDKTGEIPLAFAVSVLNFGTSPLYTAAACALAKTRVKPALTGLVLGNALSFLALYYFGQAFGKSLVSLASAAVLTSVLAVIAFYLIARYSRA